MVCIDQLLNGMVGVGLGKCCYCRSNRTDENPEPTSVAEIGHSLYYRVSTGFRQHEHCIYEHCICLPLDAESLEEPFIIVLTDRRKLLPACLIVAEGYCGDGRRETLGLQQRLHHLFHSFRIEV